MRYESAGLEAQGGDAKAEQAVAERKVKAAKELRGAQALIDQLEPIPEKHLTPDQKVALMDAYSARTNLSRELGLADPFEQNRWAA
jgi:hypothetical protein